MRLIINTLITACLFSLVLAPQPSGAPGSEPAKKPVQSSDEGDFMNLEDVRKLGGGIPKPGSGPGPGTTPTKKPGKSEDPGFDVPGDKPSKPPGRESKGEPVGPAPLTPATAPPAKPGLFDYTSVFALVNKVSQREPAPVEVAADKVGKPQAPVHSLEYKQIASLALCTKLTNPNELASGLDYPKELQIAKAAPSPTKVTPPTTADYAKHKVEAPTGTLQLRGASPRYGDWLIVKRLGGGNSGNAMLAWDGKKFAVLKLMAKTNNPGFPDALAPGRFKTEVNIHHRMSKLGVAFKLYEVMDDDQARYVSVGRYARGGDLKKYLVANKPTLEERSLLLFQIASKLHAMHAAGFAHRDIKPENIFMSKFRKEPFIGDFGEATSLDNPVDQACRRGDAETMAPEMGIDANEAWARDLRKMDAYAFGRLVLFVYTEQLLKPVCGKVPMRDQTQQLTTFEFVFAVYEDITQTAAFKGAPKDVRDAVAGLMDRDWNRRMSIADFLRTPLMVAAAKAMVDVAAKRAVMMGGKKK